MRGKDGYLELLFGKVYGSWKGHEKEALQTYDALMGTGDFRAYLAKGLFVKSMGKTDDASLLFDQVCRVMRQVSPIQSHPSMLSSSLGTCACA